MLFIWTSLTGSISHIQHFTLLETCQSLLRQFCLFHALLFCKILLFPHILLSTVTLSKYVKCTAFSIPTGFIHCNHLLFHWKIWKHIDIYSFGLTSCHTQYINSIIAIDIDVCSSMHIEPISVSSTHSYQDPLTTYI